MRIATRLPVPLVDPADEAAALLATATVVEPEEISQLVESAAEPSRKLRLRLARAHLDADDPAAASAVLDELAVEDPDDWRLGWYCGDHRPARGRSGRGDHLLRPVYTALPGEPAAKLALAAAAECAEQDEAAERRYRLVARVDRGYADALFGLARTRIRRGNRVGALRVLDAVPESSSRHVAAQLGAVQTILLANGAVTDEAQLRAAAARVERLPLDPATDQEVRASLLNAAISTVATDPHPEAGPFLGHRWAEHQLRLALERCLRTAARLTSDPAARIALVDRANAARPRTWL